MKDCLHPVCRDGKLPSSSLCWYEGGPLVTYIPLPAVDLKRPYGLQPCSNCESQCAGQFLPPKELIEACMKGDMVTQQKEPPTEVLKDHSKNMELWMIPPYNNWLRSVYCQLLG